MDAFFSRLFGELQWLSLFHSDFYRLLAVGVVCLAWVSRRVPEVMRVWADDRRDRRAHERKKLALMLQIDDRIARREAERLDLDD